MRVLSCLLFIAGVLIPSVVQGQIQPPAQIKPDAETAPQAPAKPAQPRPQMEGERKTESKAPDNPAPDAKPNPLTKLESDSGAGYRIEFLGREPSSDWAKAAGILVDKQLVPVDTLQLAKGQDPCTAVLEKLNFRSFGLGCSAELKALIEKLNPDLAAPAPINAPIKYPRMPLTATSWFAGFDLSVPEDVDRYNKVNEAWKPFKTKETAKGALKQIEFRGFGTHIAPPQSAEAVSTLENIEHYDSRLQRLDTRLIPLSAAPLLKQRFSLDTPLIAAEQCMQDPNSLPPSPLPPYITMLGGTKDDMKCVAKCADTDSCPEIVLIDQAVARHPDIAPALRTQPAAVTPKWCPFVPFDGSKHHGTHMAGLMVSSGATSGFRGLAPNATLDNQDTGTLLAQKIKSIVIAKNDSTHPVVFVFASEFPGTAATLPNRAWRFSKPAYVEDILQSGRLWVVAAGQPPNEEAEPQQIGEQTPASPMNLGDRGNILVVTACERCYSNNPTISPWAYYSGWGSGGLVNLAAPGGTAAKRIPSLVTEQGSGLAHGTSQAAALVGGLAAAMMSCYPTSYSGQSLKSRLLTTARPPLSRDVSQKVSVGIVDASKALLDPNLHWVTLKSTSVQEKFKGISWCKQDLSLKDLNADDDDSSSFSVNVKSIRRLVRNRQDGGSDGWFVFYQTPKSVDVGATIHVPMQTIRVAALATPPDRLRPLLYFQQGPGNQARPPVPIDDVDDLLIALDPSATRIPQDFAGCR